MQKLKPTRLLGFLPILVATTMHGVVNAQAQMSANIQSLIPATDIYCDGNYPTASFTLPPNYQTDNPELCAAPTVSSNIPAGVVDWILIELRAIDNSGTEGSTNVDNAGDSTVIARKPAFLLSNGRIVDAEQYASGIGDGSLSACTTASLTTEDPNCPDVVFDQGDVAGTINSADLYLVIRHRNHLDIISNTHLLESSESPGVYSYDFSTGVSQARGGANALKLSNATSAMYAGDTDGDGSILGGDYTGVVVPQLGSITYQYGDTNMDGTVLGGDYTSKIVPSLGSVSQVPN